jgi:hypothetical protein
MVAELLQPPRYVLVGLMLANVVDEQGADSATVICGGDGAVSLLAGRVPDLRLDRLCVDLDGSGGELDADGRLGVEVELVARESAQEVRLSDAGISDEHNCGGLARGVRTLRAGIPLKRNCTGASQYGSKRGRRCGQTHIIFVVRHRCGGRSRACAVRGL